MAGAVGSSSMAGISMEWVNKKARARARVLRVDWG